MCCKSSWFYQHSSHPSRCETVRQTLLFYNGLCTLITSPILGTESRGTSFLSSLTIPVCLSRIQYWVRSYVVLILFFRQRSLYAYNVSNIGQGVTSFFFSSMIPVRLSHIQYWTMMCIVIMYPILDTEFYGTSFLFSSMVSVCLPRIQYWIRSFVVLLYSFLQWFLYARPVSNIGRGVSLYFYYFLQRSLYC